jgi:hypothetical protein
VNKKFNMTNLIVSVESRKGGVGKTTAALCMARLLKKMKYAVLVLDLDVTGTNAADIANSPFWVQDLHVICKVSENGLPNVPINLIKMFDECFMTGMRIPDFSSQDNCVGKMHIDSNKVNVLGSQINRTDDSGGNDNQAICIERPEILFDDLHTLWLLELVKKIIDNFERTVRLNKKDSKLAIILDNSPGYVGIAPSIHEWLTDRGPACSKFLIVTSLDKQDLCACDRAIEVLHGLYKSKWQTSRLINDNSSKGDGIKVDRDQEAFFLRLVSSSNNHSKFFDPLAFYKKIEKNPSQQHKEEGQRFHDHPDEYIAAIINRVPRAIKAGRFLEYRFFEVLSGDSVLGRLLEISDEKKAKRNRMVSYDEYIENQFLLLQQQRRGRGSHERRVHQLIEELETAEDKLRMGIHETDNQPIRFHEMDDENHESLKSKLDKANDIVSHARSAVEDTGLGHLARLIHDEWLPGSILPDFRSALHRVLRESDYPHFEMMPVEFDSDPTNQEVRMFMMDFKKNIRMELRHLKVREAEINDSQTINVLSGVLSWLVALSLTPSLWHSPMRKEISRLFAGILAVELKHWARRGEGKYNKYGIQRFLAQETVNEDEFREDMELFMPLRFFRHNMMKDGEDGIVEFYEVCTSAQARLIDFVADSRFLLQLLRFIVKGEMKNGTLFPFVKGIAEEVIVKKTLSHEDSKAKMAKALQTAEYFQEFDRVLNDTLKAWEVTYE